MLRPGVRHTNAYLDIDTRKLWAKHSDIRPSYRYGVRRMLRPYDYVCGLPRYSESGLYYLNN